MTKKQYPEFPEPVAFRVSDHAEPEIGLWLSETKGAYWQATEPLYTSDQMRACIDADRAKRGVEPAPREPLTKEVINAAIQQHVDPVATYRKLHAFARAIEAAHGITTNKEQPNG